MLKRFSLTVFFALLLAAVSADARTEERVIRKAFALNHDGIVHLSNVNGDITIRGWDKNEVEMKATKRGRPENLDDLEIEIKSTSERLTIETKYPRNRRDNDLSVDYELMVPKRVKLDSISTVNSSVDVSGVEGEIRVETVNGSVDLQGSKSPVEANTVNGNVTARWAEFPPDGGIKMETVNGRLEVRIPSNANANLQASSLNGSIQTDFPVTVQGRFLSRKLQGKIGAGGININLSTVNGGIEILRAE